MLFPSRLTETPGLEKPTQYWMIWLIGGSPYYRSDSTRLLVALINGGTRSWHGRTAPSPWVRYRRISFECQREKLFGGKLSGTGLEACFNPPHHHRMRADAQVNPAPKAPNITKPPSLIRPWRTASSKAMGIEAADVFPYRSRFSITFYGGSPRRSATALRMRPFAWCGT